MLDLELFISPEAYQRKIDQVEGQYTSLMMILDQYNELNNQLSTLVTGEDDESILPQLRERAVQQITAIKTMITRTLTCKAQLQKTLETMEENANKMKNIVDDATSTAKNVVETAKDAADVAATAAGVAALL